MGGKGRRRERGEKRRKLWRGEKWECTKIVPKCSNGIMGKPFGDYRPCHTFLGDVRLMA